MSTDDKSTTRNAASDVFIIDDDREVRQQLREALSELGFSVVEAGSNHQVLKTVQERKWTWAPSAILLDLVLPEASGFDLIRMLRQRYESRNVPIIVMSRLGGSVDIREAQYAGAAGYIVKPFSTTDVVELVQTAIDAGETPLAVGGKIPVITPQ